jgi:integrase/recombinase XerC
LDQNNNVSGLIREELMTGFGDYLSYERRYSTHTVEGYGNDIHQFAAFLDHQYGSISLPEITHHHVRSWVVRMLQEKLSPVSVRRKLSSLNQWFRWLRKKGHVEINPLARVSLPKTPERLPGAVPEKAIQRLWENLDKADTGKTAYTVLRDKVIIALLYGSGLRRSEAIQLQWTDIDFTRNTMLIVGKGKKYRQLPLPEKTRQLLLLLRQEPPPSTTESHVLLTDSGKPCYPKFVHNRVVVMLGTVTTAARKSPHVLRHSMATHMMDHGAALNTVKTILGHSSLAATQVYTHNSIARLKEVYRKSHPGAGESP